MHTISIRNTLALALAALLLMAAVSSGSSVFRAAAPGQDLEPVNGAEEVIQLLQGSRTILWTTLGASVSSVVTLGWPSASNGSELGGALVMEIPADGSAGVIDFGEKPMSATFETAG